MNPAQHPIIAWASILSLVAGFAAGGWMVLDMRSQLDRIEDHLTDADAQSDQRFSVRADEHRWLGTEINRVLGTVATELGAIRGECN